MKIKMPILWAFQFIFILGFMLNGKDSFSQGITAQEIIQQSQNFYYGLKDMTVDFSYEVKGVSARHTLQKGTLQIKKARYVLKMNDQETYCDTRRIWVYLPQNNEYMMFSMGDWTYGNIMQLIYSMYFHHSDVDYQGEEVLRDGSRTHKIRFQMTDPKVSYSTAYAWYNESTKLLDRIVFLDRNKRQRIFTFYNLRFNTNLDNDIFVFRPQNYPGIELRR